MSESETASFSQADLYQITSDSKSCLNLEQERELVSMAAHRFVQRNRSPLSHEVLENNL